jgi:hypothetical protein
MAVIRAKPFSMLAHSVTLCQGILRTPPAVSRMLAPATSVAMGSSRTVVWGPQPPSDKMHMAVGEGLRSRRHSFATGVACARQTSIDCRDVRIGLYPGLRAKSSR